MENNNVFNEKQERFYEVNGKKLTQEEFEALKQDRKISLKEIAPFVYKKLDQMFG